MNIAQYNQIDEDNGNYYSFRPIDPTDYCIIVQWCKENLKHHTEYDTNDFSGHIFIYNESDAMAFKLRWL